MELLPPTYLAPHPAQDLPVSSVEQVPATPAVQACLVQTTVPADSSVEGALVTPALVCSGRTTVLVASSLHPPHHNRLEVSSRQISLHHNSLEVSSLPISPQHNSLVASSLPANPPPPPPSSLVDCSEVSRAVQPPQTTRFLVRPPSALYNPLFLAEGEPRPLHQHQLLEPRAPSDSLDSLCLQDPPRLQINLCLLPTQLPTHSAPRDRPSPFLGQQRAPRQEDSSRPPLSNSNSSRPPPLFLARPLPSHNNQPQHPFSDKQLLNSSQPPPPH